MRLLLLTLALCASGASAAVPTPERPLTDPRAVVSAERAAARPAPLDDLGFSRRVDSAAWSADGRSVFLAVNLTGRMNVWRMDAAGGFPVQLVQSDDAQLGLATTPDGATVIYAQDRGGNEMHDLYAVPAAGGPAVDLTNTPDQREEDARVSPDGRRLAFTVKPKARAQADLAVMNLATRAVRPLTHEADPSMRWHAVAWVEGGRALIARRENAGAATIETWRIDTATGAARKLLGRPDVQFAPEDATEEGAEVAITSNVDTGVEHAGVLDTASGRIRWLKATPWEQHAVAFSPDGRQLLVSTNVDGYLDLSLMDVATGAERPLALPRGVNTVEGPYPFSPDGARLLISHSAGDDPAELMVVPVAGGQARPLARLALAGLNPAVLPPSRVVTFASFDGTRISGVLTLPFNLRRDGANPAVVIAHGGPAGQSQPGFNALAAALATRGYVVIAPNPRGSTGYGTAFQKADFKDLGGADLKDEIAAKSFLVATGYVDPRRVGITGGSYGGFMTLMALGRAPEAFAAGVQMYGILNWRTMWTRQDAMMQAYQRSLLGAPEGNDAVYDAASPLTYLENARAPLLSMQGENDIRVPRDQAQAVADTLKAKGVTTEVVFYPGEGHGFRKREHVVDALRRTVAWFDTYLKAAPAGRPAR